MQRQSQQPRIAVVTREPRLAGVLGRWGTRDQARFVRKRARMDAAMQREGVAAAAAMLAAAQDEDFEEMEDEATTYQRAVQRLTSELDFGMPVQRIDRRYLPNFDFEMCSVVVVVGQDGLVANTAKYVGDVPIVGVNPDPDRFDGVLLPFRLLDAAEAVSHTLLGRARLRPVTLAQATLHDGQSLLAFNDLFIGASSHVSARYELRVRNEVEAQSSSGILVSTGAGATGWMSSVLNMARGVARSLGGPALGQRDFQLHWEDRRLAWAVREPFISRTSSANMVAGLLDEGDEMIVHSRMAEGGVIFSDGIENDFVEFNGGAIARIDVAPRPAQLVVK